MYKEICVETCKNDSVITSQSVLVSTAVDAEVLGASGGFTHLIRVGTRSSTNVAISVRNLGSSLSRRGINDGATSREHEMIISENRSLTFRNDILASRNEEMFAELKDVKVQLLRTGFERDRALALAERTESARSSLEIRKKAQDSALRDIKARLYEVELERDRARDCAGVTQSSQTGGEPIEVRLQATVAALAIVANEKRIMETIKDSQILRLEVEIDSLKGELAGWNYFFGNFKVAIKQFKRIFHFNAPEGPEAMQ